MLRMNENKLRMLILILFLTLCGFGCNPQTEIAFVQNMGIGWNLGNSLDAYVGDSPYWTVEDSEIYWGNPLTTADIIEEIKKAGFDTVRVPVTWYEHMDEDGMIDSTWMNRVKEVIDYILEADMYAIINIHHDEWYMPTYANQEDAADMLRTVWGQIAEYFKRYDNRLLFEGMNESRWIGSEVEWTGGNEETWDVVNTLNQIFVTTVRESGGNNRNRYLLVPTYGASVEPAALTNFKLPEGENLIVSVHAYIPYFFTLQLDGASTWSSTNKEHTKPIESFMKQIQEIFISNGIPVIISEFGAIDKGNTASRVEWVKYFTDCAKKYDIMYIWWDDGGRSEEQREGFQLFDRYRLEWTYPQIRDAMLHE